MERFTEALFGQAQRLFGRNAIFDFLEQLHDRARQFGSALSDAGLQLEAGLAQILLDLFLIVDIAARAVPSNYYAVAVADRQCSQEVPPKFSRRGSAEPALDFIRGSGGASASPLSEHRLTFIGVDHQIPITLIACRVGASTLVPLPVDVVRPAVRCSSPYYRRHRISQLLESRLAFPQRDLIHTHLCRELVLGNVDIDADHSYRPRVAVVKRFAF